MIVPILVFQKLAVAIHPSLTLRFTSTRENPMMQKSSHCDRNTIKGLQHLKGRCMLLQRKGTRFGGSRIRKVMQLLF
ncbi:hypothetical protein L3X38_032843 [Prunus dulcis]|uniref:Uncharacterized protein n=1 Tax=Prunus dulcis TaxID=3755 RepID=A0AAD4VFZ2_PRUDU|nr:hypothetical protein L3X38_032843 [Prunus dulcis]